MEIDIKKGKNKFFIGEDEMRPQGYASYKMDDYGDFILDSTEVADSLEGQGIGTALVNSVVDYAREEGKMITPTCPFARVVMERDRESKKLIKG